MNNWRAVSYIFLGFGLVILFIGLYYASEVSAAVSAVTNTANTIYPGLTIVPTETPQIVFANMFTPFAGATASCWVIAVVGAVAGAKQKHIVQTKLA